MGEGVTTAMDDGGDEALRESRLARLERAYGTQSPTIDERLKRLEEAGKNSESKNSWLTALDYFLKFLGALTPVALFFLGLFIKDSVETAFREREVVVKEGYLDIASAQAMEHLLASLRRKNVSEGDAEAAASMITGYALHGIRPLIMELNLTRAKKNRSNAAEGALLSYALTEDREAVCAKLRRVFVMDPALFDEGGIERVARLLGSLGCVAALQDLKAFAAAGGGNDAVRKAVSNAVNALENKGRRL